MSLPKSPPPAIDGFTYGQGIGGGGFADVFLYTQLSTGRGVAVKVLRSEHLSDASLAQFEMEARVMAGVSTHPYIVTIHDAGIASDGRPYLVMEHYPQPHFGRRASGGHLPISEVLRVGVQVSSAVETAHRAGILHRDIKPANILTSAYGDPGLTDFGLAGVQSDQGMAAASGISYGFSAPEVVLDEWATGSVASDVFALGATLYALLSGRSPVYVPGGDNSSATLARRVSSSDVQPLRREDLPRALDHLLRTTLSTHPEQRPDSALELAHALRDVEQELRLPPTPLTVTTSGPKTAVGISTGTVAAPPPPRHEDDGATRRAPRVVHAHEAPVVAPAVEAAPATPVGRGAADSASASGRGTVIPDDATVARGAVGAPVRTGAVTDLGETVHRPSAAPGPSGHTSVVPDTPPPVTSSGPARPWLALAVAVTVAVVIAGVIMIGGGDGDDSRNSRSEPTVYEAPVNPDEGGDLGAFDINDIEVLPDGSVKLAWTLPGSADDPALVIYEVRRTDLPNEPIIETVRGKRSVTIAAASIMSDPPTTHEGVCFVVTGTVGPKLSDSGSQQCRTWNRPPPSQTSTTAQP